MFAEKRNKVEKTVIFVALLSKRIMKCGKKHFGLTCFICLLFSSAGSCVDTKAAAPAWGFYNIIFKLRNLKAFSVKHGCLTMVICTSKSERGIMYCMVWIRVWYVLDMNIVFSDHLNAKDESTYNFTSKTLIYFAKLGDSGINKNSFLPKQLPLAACTALCSVCSDPWPSRQTQLRLDSDPLLETPCWLEEMAL